MSFINPNPFTTRPEIDGTFGVVASTHWLATDLLARRFPRVIVEPDVLYTDNGQVLTSAGAAAVKRMSPSNSECSCHARGLTNASGRARKARFGR